MLLYSWLTHIFHQKWKIWIQPSLKVISLKPFFKISLIYFVWWILYQEASLVNLKQWSTDKYIIPFFLLGNYFSLLPPPLSMWPACSGGSCTIWTIPQLISQCSTIYLQCTWSSTYSDTMETSNSGSQRLFLHQPLSRLCSHQPGSFRFGATLQLEDSNSCIWRQYK